MKDEHYLCQEATAVTVQARAAVEPNERMIITWSF